MDTQAKRTLITTVLCLAVLIGWMKLIGYLYPQAPEQTTSAPAATQPAAAPVLAERPPTPTSGAAPGATSAPATAASTRPAGEFVSPAFIAAGAPLTPSVTLGDDRQNNPSTGFTNPFDLGLVISPRGAAVESLKLSRHRDKPAKDRKNPKDDPYPLLNPVENPQDGTEVESFVTESIRLVEDKASVSLDDVTWSLRKETSAAGDEAILQTRIKAPSAGGESEVLELSKTYFLPRNSPQLRISLQVRNLSNQPRSVILNERGPIGIKAEDPQRDYRRVLAAVLEEETGQIKAGANVQRDAVVKAEKAEYELLPGEGHQRLWAAVGNKYFTCIVDPQPTVKGAKYADYIAQVFARAMLDKVQKANDLTLAWLLKPKSALTPQGQPGDTVTFAFDVYCGPKGTHAMDSLPPELRARHYELVGVPDVPSCTFSFLTSVMLWLLTHTYRLVHNYGIAIIVLVVIVRLILHPISKFSQVNMIKMQKGMAQLKPKLEAIQQQYKNDKQRLSEEQAKLFREEGINPASNFLSCLPMFLQMPIWVALWTTLNTDVDLRHQPFCLWMQDLASQDALIPLAGSYHIPLIGSMMGPITAFNLLPIIMTITMWAQQKITQKMSAPATPPPQKVDKDGNPVPDQMAQQQKMMGYMTIFFGFIFYNFPSGLNLYILSSNLLGMLEQYIIKKELRRKEARGDFEVKKKPEAATGRPSLFGRYIEMLQKTAEDARRPRSDRSPDRDDKKRNKTRP